MINFNLFNTILLLGIIHGGVMTLLLFNIRKRNVKANRLLALFVLLITLTMVGRLIKESSILNTFPNFLAIPDAIIFLYGPLMFLYFRKLLVREALSTPQLLVHFIPAVLFILSEIPLLFDEEHWLRTLWREHTRIRFIAIEGGALLHNAFYLYLIRNLASQYVRVSDDNFAFKQHPPHLKSIFILAMVTLLIWMSSYFSWVFRYYNILSEIGYRLVWIILAFTTYLLGYFAMKNPEFYKMTIHERNGAGMDNEEKSNILNLLNKVMTENKPYLKADFDLQRLADLLSINKNKASQLINSEFEKNFNEWTNDYRISDAQSLLAETDLSIKEIYFKVGFNSKSVFNDAFKKRLNTTPSKYKHSSQAS